MPDTVIPIGAFDTCGNVEDIILVTGWVLDRLLDPGKVEVAYRRLVETWPILSARLRTDAKTRKWEYHLPSEFSASRPQYVFKVMTVAGSVHDRYKYSKPSNAINCTITEIPDELFCEGCPRSNQDLIQRDIPLVQLQLTLFDDATIVGLTTPHIFCDGYGNREIIYALSRILSGESLAPLRLGDPLVQFVNAEKLEAPPYWRVFTTWQTALFLAWLLWDIAWNRDIQRRDVFFPKEAVIQIKQEAMDDIKKERGEGSDCWISTSDALVAFCLKCIHGPTASQLPLNIVYSANVRRYIPDVMPQPYLHNGAFSVVTPTLPVSAVSTMSLGALAYHIRETIRAQTTPDAIKTCINWRSINAGRTTLFFDPNGVWNAVTNWRDIKFMDIDFSGALADGAEKVKCMHFLGHSYQPFSARNTMGLLTDDPSGGIWMAGTFHKSVWERSDGFEKGYLFVNYPASRGDAVDEVF